MRSPYFFVALPKKHEKDTAKKISAATTLIGIHQSA